jgi:hypothetical protein
MESNSKGIETKSAKIGSMVVLQDSSEIDPEYIGSTCVLLNVEVWSVDEKIVDLTCDAEQDKTSIDQFILYSVLMPEGHVIRLMNRHSFEIFEKSEIHDNLH